MPDIQCLYIYVKVMYFSNVILILRVQFEKQDHETLFSTTTTKKV